MEPFFSASGADLLPQPSARSPWSPHMLHGRVLGGLAARAIEAEHLPDGMRPARITVDLFKSSGFVPLQVTTSAVRTGRRIRVVDALVTGPEGPVARATCVMLREGEQPTGGGGWARQPWDVSPPGDGPAHDGVTPLHMWWPEGGSPTGQRRAWMKEVCALVDDEPLTPFVRAVLAADLASPMTHWGESALAFINADYTLHLARLPEGEVIGFEGGGHLSADGIAAGHCVIYDAKGPIGHSNTTAVATPPLGS
ncbi:thioesterase family protein [Actinocorallia sp. A-T 12471]|nr:acyl-CoA thioesterase domain-containing protein [Actinocorallia sp. A-T 12471]MDX6739355.1 thioesterase family protein [Actinocorallia sp. A-T 12471]